MVFPVVMYGCESWTVRKAEHWRIDAFELWCWRRLLGVLWASRGSNQPILKEISHWKDWCWSLNSNTLATSCEKLTHWKRLWCWEGLGAGGEGDKKVWDGWMASPTRWTWVWVNSESWWWTGRPGVLEFMGSQRVRHNWVIELNWTVLSCVQLCDPIDCIPQVFSVHGISQVRILEWVSIPYSRGSSWPRDRTCISCVSCIGRWILDHWGTCESLKKKKKSTKLLSWRTLQNEMNNA